MKDKYLQTICDNLNKNGFRERCLDDILLSEQTKEFSPEYGEISTFKFLPEDNLKKMAEYYVGRFSLYESLYQAWGREGFLKFTPYVVLDDQSVPVLCLRRNRFMYVFRSYYFQISETFDGAGIWNIGPYSIEGLIRMIRRGGKAYEQSNLMYILLYSSMIHCGSKSDTFMETFRNNREVIDDFFKQSMSDYSIFFDKDSSVIERYMSYRYGMLEASTGIGPVYEIKLSDGKPYCRFAVSRCEVQIEYNSMLDSTLSRIVTFTMPKFGDGISCGLRPVSDDCIEEINDELENAIGKDETPMHFVLLMLLEFIGVYVSNDDMHLIRRLNPIPVLNEFNAEFTGLDSIRGKFRR